MSCSSCSRMWQCHTYSLPPVLGLGGTANGTVGSLNVMITVVTSPAFIRTVSFQPLPKGAAGKVEPDRVGVAVIGSGGSALVAGTTLNRMSARILGPNPGNVAALSGFLLASSGK